MPDAGSIKMTSTESDTAEAYLRNLLGGSHASANPLNRRDARGSYGSAAKGTGRTYLPPASCSAGRGTRGRSPPGRATGLAGVAWAPREATAPQWQRGLFLQQA
jgi:hypothetical protein